MGNKEGKRPESMVERFGALYGLDDVIRIRAADAVQHPILAYPTADNDTGSYEYFTGRDVDVMVDQAARILMSHGFGPVCLTVESKNDMRWRLTFTIAIKPPIGQENDSYLVHNVKSSPPLQPIPRITL